MKKPFHKKIGQGVRKYHRHFTKYLYERDTIFATIWVFIFIVVLGSIPINFYFLNPIKLALKDFDFNDMTYAKLGRSTDIPLDSNIVIINIGHADREELSYIIDKTASFGPKVMGLDAVFSDSLDFYKDSLFAATIKRHSNLVLASRIDWSKKKDSIMDYGYFNDSTLKRGYANLIGESAEERRSIRYYGVYEKEKKKQYLSFGSRLIKEYDSIAFNRSMKRKNKVETLNYSRDVDHYWVIQVHNLMLPDGVDSAKIKGKIALLGYIGADHNDVEDRFFTPMNEKFVGKSTPDMNGVVIHANYISMTLAKDYIKVLPSWVNWLVAALIAWLHMSFFIRYYLESHIWFHLVAKIAQLLSAIFFVYLGMLVFDKYNIKLDMKYSLIAIALAVDVIYFYEAFAVWMHKKFHYHTVFHQKHH